MEAEAVVEEAANLAPSRGRHIKKRALKNKALSVTFDEKNLRDFVSGFHKRKKKRRKEAQRQLQEVQRRKRIDARKKRKLEREHALYGEAQPATDSGPVENGENDEEDEEEEENEPIASVSGTTMYDNDDMQVIVTTSEISREEKDSLSKKAEAAEPRAVGGAEKKHKVPVSKKPLKKVAKNRSHPKRHGKKNSKKGKKRGKRMH